jgi:hypothetical protein
VTIPAPSTTLIHTPANTTRHKARRGLSVGTHTLQRRDKDHDHEHNQEHHANRITRDPSADRVHVDTPERSFDSSGPSDNIGDLSAWASG